jgi:hypothetical protein
MTREGNIQGTHPPTKFIHRGTLQTKCPAGHRTNKGEDTRLEHGLDDISNNLIQEILENQ